MPTTTEPLVQAICNGLNHAGQQAGLAPLAWSVCTRATWMELQAHTDSASAQSWARILRAIAVDPDRNVRESYVAGVGPVVVSIHVPSAKGMRHVSSDRKAPRWA